MNRHIIGMMVVWLVLVGGVCATTPLWTVRGILVVWTVGSAALLIGALVTAVWTVARVAYNVHRRSPLRDTPFTIEEDPS